MSFIPIYRSHIIYDFLCSHQTFHKCSSRGSFEIWNGYFYHDYIIIKWMMQSPGTLDFKSSSYIALLSWLNYYKVNDAISGDSLDFKSSTFCTYIAIYSSYIFFPHSKLIKILKSININFICSKKNILYCRQQNVYFKEAASLTSEQDDSVPIVDWRNVLILEWGKRWYLVCTCSY